jgi:hypothetical protein
MTSAWKRSAIGVPVERRVVLREDLPESREMRRVGVDERAVEIEE